MGRPTDKSRVAKWQSRVTTSDKQYKAWASRFDVDSLERLYIGEHHDTEKPENYTVNLCYPSVETRLSMMTVDRPKFRVEAKPQRADDQGSSVEDRARLREDTLNCIIQDESVGFIDSTSLCVKEAHFRFAVVEIGYTNDFIDNPNAGKPILDEKGDATGLDQPDKIPQEDAHEYVFVKRIPPKNWRVSLNAGNNLEQADWCGYCEDHFVSDVKANPRYSNTASLKGTGQIKDSLVDPMATGEENQSKQGMVKLWKIWNIREQQRLVFAEGADKFLLEEDYDIFPFAALKFHEIPDEWYPLPPMFNWRDPQRSLNETRMAQMAYLGAAYLKFLVRSDALTDAELGKLEKRQFGAIAKVEGTTAPLSDVLVAVQHGGMDASYWRNVPQSKEDFIQISAVSSEQRGVPDSNTATQANIVDINSKRREVKDAAKVAAWMAKIGKIMLQTIRKRMALPFVVLTNVDPLGPNAQEEAATVIRTWKEITSDQLGDENYEVSLNVESLSPTSDQEQQQQWINVMGIMANPPVMAAMAQSKLLTQKITGFKSDRDITEVQKAFQGALQQMQQMQQQTAQAKAGAQGGPPGMEQIIGAMAQQMGGGQ